MLNLEVAMGAFHLVVRNVILVEQIAVVILREPLRIVMTGQTALPRNTSFVRSG